RAASLSLHGALPAVRMSRPVCKPLSAYRNAQTPEKRGNPPAFSIGMKEKHDPYWKTEAAMAEGNPILMLERGEKVEMPPALWVQGRPDIVHDYHDDDSDFPGNEPERFVSNYRKAGGDIEIVYVPNDTRSTSVSFDPIAAFFKRPLGSVLRRSFPQPPPPLPSPCSRGGLGSGERASPRTSRRAPAPQCSGGAAAAVSP